MRLVRRCQAIPPTVRPDGIGGVRTAEWIANYPASLDFKFDDYWNRADVRGALYASQGRVCAYCGCELRRGDRGDVDHYRPKGNIAGDKEHGGYWWLAYAFDNYYLACRTCNTIFKGNKFPLAETAVRVRFESREQLAHEARLLIDPCADELDDLLDVDFSSALFPIRPKSGLPDPIRQRVEHTLQFFAINDQVELTKARMAVVQKVTKAIDQGQPRKVRGMAIRYRPHSLVARQLLAKNVPEVLPNDDDALKWLMGDMIRTFRLILQHRLAHDTARLENDSDELLWSFAFLLTDPPGSKNLVEAFLRAGEIEAEVLEKHAQL